MYEFKHFSFSVVNEHGTKGKIEQKFASQNEASTIGDVTSKYAVHVGDGKLLVWNNILKILLNNDGDSVEEVVKMKKRIIRVTKSIKSPLLLQSLIIVGILQSNGTSLTTIENASQKL
jgi:hypothetical protein